MSSPKCDHRCPYHRMVKAVQKLEDDTWNEFERSDCFHPNALKLFKPDRNGGVAVGKVCWTCSGRWQ